MNYPFTMIKTSIWSIIWVEPFLAQPHLISMETRYMSGQHMSPPLGLLSKLLKLGEAIVPWGSMAPHLGLASSSAPLCWHTVWSSHPCFFSECSSGLCHEALWWGLGVTLWTCGHSVCSQGRQHGKYKMWTQDPMGPIYISFLPLLY